MFAGASLDENSGAFCELKANFFRLILTKAEALALTPGDFDFNNLKIHITKAFDYKITNEFCKTKNESSVRSILLDYRTALNFEKLTKGMDMSLCGLPVKKVWRTVKKALSKYTNELPTDSIN